MKFGIGIILYFPDENVLKRLKEYSKIFEILILFDNTPVDYENRQLFKNISSQYKWNHNNLGMSLALNYIFQQAFANNLDYVLTMDQDSEFTNDSIRNMMTFIQEYRDRKSVGIFCPNYQRIFGNKDFTKKLTSTKIAKNEVSEVKECMTSGSFVSCSVVKKLLPLKDLFIEYVDNDLCYEMKSIDKSVIMVGSVILRQQVGESVKSSRCNRFLRGFRQSKIKYFYMGRNNKLLRKKYRKNYNLQYRLIVNLFRIFLNILLVEVNKKQKIRAVFLGCHDAKSENYGPITEKSFIKLNGVSESQKKN